jgi:hypothetical protein
VRGCEELEELPAEEKMATRERILDEYTSAFELEIAEDFWEEGSCAEECAEERAIDITCNEEIEGRDEGTDEELTSRETADEDCDC